MTNNSLFYIPTLLDSKDFIKVSNRYKRYSLKDKGLKLGEETGEVMQELLAYNKGKNVSASATGSKEKVVEELTDVILVAYDIINKLDGGNMHNDIIRKKLAKWESKLDKK